MWSLLMENLCNFPQNIFNDNKLSKPMPPVWVGILQNEKLCGIYNL